MDLAKLPPALNFDSYIARSTHDFTGREWVFEDIDRWLANSNGKRFFTVTGEPGSGKTALASYLVLISQASATVPERCPRLTNGFLKAVHFCSARDRHWINPRVFTESLASQLAQTVPGYVQALLKRSGDRQVNLDVDVKVESGSATGVVIHNLNLGEVTPEDAFARFVREPLEEAIRAGHEDQIVILLDALDESLLYTQEVGIPALLAETQQLPSNVRFIVTTRPIADLLRSLRRSGMEEHSLTSDAGLQFSLSDVEAYCLRRATESENLRQLLAPDVSASKFAKAIRDKSDGNFLYVTMLLSTLEASEDTISLKSIERFPAGLDEFYLEFLDRLKKKRPEFDDLLLLLGALSVNREPLTEKQLSSVLGVNRPTIRKQLERVRQLLEEDSSPTNEPTYALFHRSFVDFLLDGDRSAEFWREEQEQHRQFVSAYFVSAAPLRLKHTDDHYLWHHLIHHLCGADMHDTARHLLLNYSFVEKKLFATDVDALLADFDALRPDDSITAIRTSLVLSSHLLREDPKHLRGQILGRLLDNKNSSIKSFVEDAVAAYKGEVGLRPLTPSLTRPAGLLRQTIHVGNAAVEGVVLGANAQWILATLGIGEYGRPPADRLVCCQFLPSRVLYSLPGHTFESFSLGMRQDGRIAATAGRELKDSLSQTQVPVIDSGIDNRHHSDHCLRVWDLEKQQELFQIICPYDHTRRIAVAGNQVLVIAESKLLAWNLETGERERIPDLDVRWDRVAARGDVVAAVAEPIIRKKRKRNELAAYYDKEPFILPVDFWPLARGESDLNNDEEIEVQEYSSERLFIIWNVNTPGQFQSFPGTFCDDLDVAPDGSKLIAVTSGRVILFDPTTRSQTFVSTSVEEVEDDKCYHYVSLLDGGSKAVSITGNYTSNDPPVMRVFDLGRGEELLRSYEHTTLVTALNTLYADSSIVTGTMNGEVKLWDINTEVFTDAQTKHTRRINALCFSPDGRLACSASDDATVGVWSLSELKMTRKLTGHKDRVNSVAFTLDGSKLISASSDHTIRLWNTNSFKRAKVLLGHEKGVNAIAVHPDGKRFLSVSTDVSIRWWDINTGAFTFLYPTSHRAHVPTQLAFDGEGSRFALGQGHGRDAFYGTSDVSGTSMVVWDQKEHGFIATGHANFDIEAVAMSRNGEFAYYTANTTVKKLRVEDNGELLVIAHDGDATGIALLPDESHAVSVSRGGDILVWDTNEGNIVTRFVMDTSLEACALSPDGHTLMVGDNAGQVHFFKLEGLTK